MEWTVDGLANKPYPGGRGETGIGSTLGSLRVCLRTVMPLGMDYDVS